MDKKLYICNGGEGEILFGNLIYRL